MSYLKEKATAFLMSRIGKTAHVIATETLADGLIALTLHLPDLLKWRSCQHLKFETGKSHYRDYTLAQYDEINKQGILLIDNGHEGPGSKWTKQLRAGQTLMYAGPGGGLHQPTSATHLVGIGDASAIGHFASLYHRKGAQQHFQTLISHHQSLPVNILDMPVTTTQDHVNGITQWLTQQQLPLQQTTFYVAGHIPLVVQTRRLLKSLGAQQIKPAGFWE